MEGFTAKKLGEVLAFADVAVETFEKGSVGFSKVFDSEILEKVIRENKAHSGKIREIAEKNGISEAVLKKAEGTSAKLRHMRDYYVGSEWEDAAELLEWSGFFEGAAVVHWKLVEGVGESLGSEELNELAGPGASFHNDLLGKVSDLIKKHSFEKVKSE